MKQEEIFKKIGTILTELQEQYRFIEKTKEDINDLELELFASNTHYLSENIEVLRKYNKMNAAPAKPAEEAPFTEKFFEPVVQPAQIFWPEKKEAKAKAEEVAPPKPEIELKEPIIRHELTLEDIGEADLEYEDEAVAEPVAEVPEQVVAAQQESTPKTEIIAPVANDKTDKAPTTINQVIAAQKANARVADKFDLPAITDLKSAITLNDKLLYVKDLFHGYSLAYSEAIEILNRFNKFEEADNFLKNNYTTKNNWEDKQATADKFYTLLRRRYPD